MIPKYLFQNRGSVTEGAPASAGFFSRIQNAHKKTRRSHVFFLYLLANMMVWNAAYGLYTAGKDTPILKAVLTDNVICRLWKRQPISPSRFLKKGIVTGILYSDEKPAAMINSEIIYEGSIVDDVRVIRIGPKKVEFERDGRTWSQGMHEIPHSAWQEI